MSCWRAKSGSAAAPSRSPAVRRRPSARTDLAAVAKGRYRGIGQVLVSSSPRPPMSRPAPSASAAYVDFPQVGLIEILRARLRL